jgi:hypothetical protein
MAHLFRVQTAKPVPSDATIVKKDGQKYVRLRRGGRTTVHPVAKGGKRSTRESRSWYFQSKDSEGGLATVVTRAISEHLSTKTKKPLD